MSSQPMDEETEARDREITCSGHFMGGDDGTAGGFGSGPDLCPLCLCMERAGRAKKSRGPSGILLPWTCVPGCPRSRLCAVGTPCPLPFFFGSFEFSIVSSVGFLCGQPIERARLLPVQALPFLRGLGLELARMGGLGELFEILGA